MAKHPPCRNLPCRNCLCIPRCSQKDYSQLFNECSKLSKYIKHRVNWYTRSQVKLEVLEEILKPKKWNLERNEGESNYYIMGI